MDGFTSPPRVLFFFLNTLLYKFLFLSGVCVWCVCGAGACVWAYRYAAVGCLHLIHQERVSQWNPELTNSAGLTSQLALETPCLCRLRAGFMGGQLCPCASYLGSEELNSGPHPCTTNTLNTELSPPVPSIQVFRLISPPVIYVHFNNACHSNSSA